MGGIEAFAVHPGLKSSTGISNHTAAGWYSSSIVEGVSSCCFAPLIKTPEQVSAWASGRSAFPGIIIAPILGAKGQAGVLPGAFLFPQPVHLSL